MQTGTSNVQINTLPVPRIAEDMIFLKLVFFTILPCLNIQLRLEPHRLVTDTEKRLQLFPDHALTAEIRDQQITAINNADNSCR